MILWKENIDKLPAYVLLEEGEQGPVNTTIVTDLTLWDRNAFRLGWDYKCVRDSMKKLVYDLGSGDIDAGFNLLPDLQKDIACKYKIGSDSIRESFAGVDTLIKYGVDYHSSMDNSRSNRANIVVSEISNRLPNQKVLIMGQSADVFYLYRVYGVEGTEYGDLVSGPADYINGTGDFTSNGLRQSGYTPIGEDLNTFCDNLIDILIGKGRQE